MEGSFGARRRSRRPAINITPLVDVMFLLLIFFMVSSTFREHFGIDVSLPTAATASGQEQPPHEIVLDAQGRIFFDRRELTIEALTVSLRELLEEEPGATVVLRADEHADVGDFIAIMDTARVAGGTQLVVPTKLPESVAGVTK